jgi:hypothetical protein
MARTPTTLFLAVVSLVGVSCGAGGGGTGGSTGPSRPGFIARDRASVTPDPITAARNSGPGDFAADFLRDTNFTSLVVEIDYPQGKAPSAAAVALLRTRLVEHCNKPDGVTVDVDDAIPAAEFRTVNSIPDIAAIEAEHRQSFSDLSTQTAAFYILYVSGLSDLDEAEGAILGVAYAGSSIAFFIDAADPGVVTVITKIEVEATGVVHEAGHLLGLVDGGVPMVREHADRAHPGHCDVTSCVMYWTVTVDPSSDVLDPSFAAFDRLCSDDLEAFGGRGTVLPLAPARIGFRVAAGVCGNEAWRRSQAPP